VKLGGSAERWLSAALGNAKIARLDELGGATSSTLYLAHTAENEPRAVLRVFSRAEWLAEEPDLVAHEMAALRAAATLGIGTPQPLASSDVDVGFGAPVVLMSVVPGKVVLPARPESEWILELAVTAATIHRHRVRDFRWRYRSWTDKAALSVPAWSRLDADTWQRAFTIVRASAPEAPEVFIHRDYHPTNVLWRDGAVSGVVDWVNACRGPAGVDVAHCRSNLAAMYGVDVADEFLAAYRDCAPDFVYQPYWDLDSALDWLHHGLAFYEPWRHFGLAPIPNELLRRRFEEHFARILART
jgi:Ser/Thr protein kinase RdoA (MazF antagonist)